jgi:putative spermidine/putrescine transport system ATP-binding protein
MDSFAIRPEAVTLLHEGAGQQEAAAGAQLVDGIIKSVSVLGNIIRCTVEAEGIRLTVDLLNDGRWLRVGEGDKVTLALNPSELLHLEREGA